MLRRSWSKKMPAVLFLPFTPPALQSKHTEHTAVCMLRPFPGKLSLLENSVHRAGVGGEVCPCHFPYSPLMTMLHLSASVPVNDKPKGPDITLVSFACDSFHSQIRNNSPYPFWAGPMSFPQWATLTLNSWHFSHGKNHHSQFRQGFGLEKAEPGWLDNLS